MLRLLAHIFTISIIFSWHTLSFSKENAISSKTVNPTNCPSVSCNTLPTKSDISKMEEFSISLSSIVTFPFISPTKVLGIWLLIALAIVDLPDPLGPMITIFSPFLALKLIFLSVGSCWDLYLNVKFSNLIKV